MEVVSACRADGLGQLRSISLCLAPSCTQRRSIPGAAATKKALAKQYQLAALAAVWISPGRGTTLGCLFQGISIARPSPKWSRFDSRREMACTIHGRAAAAIGRVRPVSRHQLASWVAAQLAYQQPRTRTAITGWLLQRPHQQVIASSSPVADFQQHQSPCDGSIQSGDSPFAVAKPIKPPPTLPLTIALSFLQFMLISWRILLPQDSGTTIWCWESCAKCKSSKMFSYRQQERRWCGLVDNSPGIPGQLGFASACVPLNLDGSGEPAHLHTTATIYLSSTSF